jgi:hypothetical protein
VSVNQ